jgi:hypothetical protein
LYVPAGDDLPLIVNSANRWISVAGVLGWFTRGYSGYFDNYPGWTPLATGFVRPVQNVVFWLASLLEPATGYAAYLLINYVAVIALAGIVALIVICYGSARPWVAIIAGVLTALSPAFQSALFTAAMGTNVIAAVLAAASIAALDARRGVTSQRILACAIFQSLAVLAHETALVMPLVAVALIAYYAPNRKVVLWPTAVLAAPGVVFIIIRLLHGAVSDVYVTQRSALDSLDRLKWFLVHSVLPYDPPRFYINLTAYPYWRTALGVIAVIATEVLVAALILNLVRRGQSKDLWLVVALFAALLPLAFGAVEARFQGFAVLVALIVFFETTPVGRMRIMLFGVTATIVGLLVIEGLVEGQPRLDTARQNASYYDYLRDSIQGGEPDTVVLVNDKFGHFGACNAPTYAAGPHSSFEVQVVNSLLGDESPDARTEVVINEDYLVIINELGADQRAAFFGNQADFGRPTTAFEYRELQDENRGSFVAVGRLQTGRTLVVGFDAKTNDFLAPIVIDR